MLVSSMVPNNFVGPIWSQVEPLLSKLIDRSHERFESIDVLHDLLINKQQLWIVWDTEEDYKIVAMLTTEVFRYPRKNYLVAQNCAGTRMKEWFDDIYENITKYAKSINCDGVEVIGRRGWISNFKKKDWKEEFVIMSKEFKRTKNKQTDLKVVNN
jgi:hypothetical protein